MQLIKWGEFIALGAQVAATRQCNKYEKAEAGTEVEAGTVLEKAKILCEMQNSNLRNFDASARALGHGLSRDSRQMREQAN